MHSQQLSVLQWASLAALSLHSTQIPHLITFLAPSSVTVFFTYSTVTGYTPAGSAAINGNAVGLVVADPLKWFNQLDPNRQSTKVRSA